ncbi:MAG: septation protein A [Arenicellales bacterium]
MKLVFDLFPLILFFVAYHAGGIFVATGVAMAAVVAQVVWLRIRKRRIEVMHIINLVVILVFGGATIYTANDVFIRWKPTILYWTFSVILFVSHFVSEKPAIQHVMGSQLELPVQVWKKINLSFAAFTLVMGALNLYVAFFYGAGLDPQVQRDRWVDFKVFGTTILTFLFVAGLMVALSKHFADEKDEEES